MVTVFISLEECARYFHVLKVNISVNGGWLDGGDAAHRPRLNGGLVSLPRSTGTTPRVQQLQLLLAGRVRQSDAKLITERTAS